MKNENNVEVKWYGANFEGTCDACDAMPCPLRPYQGSWSPDEPICNKRCYAKLHWAKMQRKIQRRALCEDDLYTQEMLEHVVVVRKGIRGLNPDRWTGRSNTKGEQATPTKKGQEVR